MKRFDRLMSFGKWLNTRGYDIGLEDELWMEEYVWGEHKIVDVFELAEEWAKEILTDYTDFLLKEGYCDSDVYTEPQSAIDKFLNPKLR